MTSTLPDARRARLVDHARECLVCAAGVKDYATVQARLSRLRDSLGTIEPPVGFASMDTMRQKNRSSQRTACRPDILPGGQSDARRRSPLACIRKLRRLRLVENLFDRIEKPIHAERLIDVSIYTEAFRPCLVPLTDVAGDHDDKGFFAAFLVGALQLL